MRRRPEELEEDEREGGPSSRAWGLVLAAWFVIFVFLGLIVVPLLFHACGIAGAR